MWCESVSIKFICDRNREISEDLNVKHLGPLSCSLRSLWPGRGCSENLRENQITKIVVSHGEAATADKEGTKELKI
jgi:hypothetical protein